MKLGLKISGIGAAAVVLLFIVTLDSVSSVWQYGVALVAVVWLLFLLVVNWDHVVRFYDVDDDTEITDLFEYNNGRKYKK